MKKYIKASDGSMVSFAKKAKRTFQPITAASNTGSPARAFANAIAEMLKKASKQNINVKVSILDRDSYKVMWWYIDMPGLRHFLNNFQYMEAVENDELEYDVYGNPIHPNSKTYISPVDALETWEDSGKLKTFAAMYGLSLESELYVTDRPEELTGSNARAWEQLTGEKLQSSNTVYTISLRLKQVGEANQAEDKDWAIKCLDMLFRHGKFYQNGKKVKITDGRWSGLYNELIRKKNVFYFSAAKPWYSAGDTSPYDVNKIADMVESKISTFYPDLLNQCDIQIADDQVILTVN